MPDSYYYFMSVFYYSLLPFIFLSVLVWHIYSAFQSWDIFAF